MSIFVNGQLLDRVTYPNNETLLRPELDGIVPLVVTLRFDGDADLFRLQILAKFLRESRRGNLRECIPATLVLPYMPYSRADRSQDGSVFTLKYACELINDLKFQKVTVVEPHSDVTTQLLHRCEVVSGAKFLLDHITEDRGDLGEDDWIIYPDKGAYERYRDLVTPGFGNIVMGTKVRDFETGKIESLKFPNMKVPEGSRALIIDDLCSRGGTFVWCAEELREMGFATVELAVTHFEKTGYNWILLHALDHIYTTDSMEQLPAYSNMTVYPLGEIA